MNGKIGLPDLLPNQTPPAAFHFLVVFYGMGNLKIPNAFDIRFQKVSGMDISVPIDDKQLPGHTKFSNLKLERGYLVTGSPLRKELEFTLENLKFKPRNVHVMLLNEESLPIASWLFYGAYPVSWTIGDLDASQSSILIETMELTYSRFQSLSL